MNVPYLSCEYLLEQKQYQDQIGATYAYSYGGDLAQVKAGTLLSVHKSYLA